MKARNAVVVGFGGLLAGVMLMATSVAASANVAWCMSDPPVQVVTPGGHSLTVNNQVYLSAAALHLMNDVTDTASAAADGRGGTLVTVHVFVPGAAHVVSSIYRYGVSAARDGTNVVTLTLDVPIT
jgi:hypothetical protein